MKNYEQSSIFHWRARHFLHNNPQAFVSMRKLEIALFDNEVWFGDPEDPNELLGDPVKYKTRREALARIHSEMKWYAK